MSRHLDVARRRLRLRLQIKWLDFLPPQRSSAVALASLLGRGREALQLQLARQKPVNGSGAPALSLPAIAPADRIIVRRRRRVEVEDFLPFRPSPHSSPTASFLGGGWPFGSHPLKDHPNPIRDPAIGLALERLSASADFDGFPRTESQIEAFLLSHGKDAVVVCDSEPPYRILDVNCAWVDLCGHRKDAAVGGTFRSLGISAGGVTDPALLAGLGGRLGRGQRTAVRLTNRTRGRRDFENYLRVVPVVEDDDEGQEVLSSAKVVRFVGLLQDVTEKYAAATVLI